MRLPLHLDPIRSYFIPIAPLGLRPSEVFPLEQPYTSRCHYPHAVANLIFLRHPRTPNRTTNRILQMPFSNGHELRQRTQHQLLDFAVMQRISRPPLDSTSEEASSSVNRSKHYATPHPKVQHRRLHLEANQPDPCEPSWPRNPKIPEHCAHCLHSSHEVHPEG